ncbi:MAG: hypothetical protein QNJ90_04920 [Planctomycetota bacterium]|nr:hypothetical protein [Planctomycetota bacterium]
MSAAPRVLLVGLHPDVVDFAKWPGLDRDKLIAGLEGATRALAEKGYDASWCLTDRGETAAETLTAALREATYACVCVGAGVRIDPEHTVLLETIIDVVRTHAPDAKLAFNTSPFDTTDAVIRNT